MSIRLRLTLLYTGLLTLVLLGFTSALYFGHSRRTQAAMEDGLVVATRRMAEFLDVDGGPDRRPPGGREDLRGRMPPFPPSGRFPDVPDRMRSPISHLQTRLADGKVAERSAGLGQAELPLDDDALVAVLGGSSRTEAVVVDDERLLVHSAPVWEDGEVVGVVQAATSLALLDQYLSGLRAALLAISGLTILVAFVAGWLMAGAVLQPIHRVTASAREIGAQRDFARRIDHPGPNDEIGQLASTINEMLAELQQAFLQVEEALQAQRRFVADASHELRTPLTTIRGNSELLQRSPPIDDADRDAVVTDIVGETERLMALVQELLELARADAGRSLAAERVAVTPLLVDLVRQAKLLAPERHIDLRSADDVTARADRDALKQVLLNLLENAFQHTPADAEITVAAGQTTDAVNVSVSDTGAGIDPELLPRIFERFYRGDAVRTSEGSGLGLAIVKSLVEAQGGTIDVVSEPGAGTTFTVTLPRWRDDA